MKKFKETWCDWIKDTALIEPVYYDGAQQIYMEQGFDVSDIDLTLEDTGYTKTKLTQLKAYYLPQDQPMRAIEIVRARMKKRKYGSALIPHQAKRKEGFTAQDFCMMGTCITYYPGVDGIRLSTSWRTTEVMKRFRGDIVFIDTIRHQIEEELQVPVKVFSFHFHNFTWHSMFYLLTMPHIKWKPHLNKLKKEHNRCFRNVIRWLHYYIVDERQNVYKYSSALQVLKIAQKQMSQKEFDNIARYVKLHYVENRRGYPK